MSLPARYPKVKILLGFFFFLLLGLVLRKVMPRPYVWVFAFLSWSVAFGFLTAAVRSEAAKGALLTAASVFLALFAAEGWLSLDAPGATPRGVEMVDVEKARQERNDPTLASFAESIDENDPVLGRRFKPGVTRLLSRGFLQGQELYNIIYTTLESGWRVTPQHPAARTAVVFFGCSYTFGMGLEDQQAFPYRVGELLGDEFQVFNFAFPGYGSHQMLAQIEHGFLEDISRRYERIIPFFLTIDDHIIRSAGQDFVHKGPRYVLEEGRLVRKGDLADVPRYSLPLVQRQLRNCLIYRRFVNLEDPQRHTYRTLHTAIMAHAGEELARRYQAGLTVLLWPGADFGDDLRARGVKVVDLNPLMPEWAGNKQRYTLQNDEHPNAMAADMLARFLAERIQKEIASGQPDVNYSISAVRQQATRRMHTVCAPRPEFRHRF